MNHRPAFLVVLVLAMAGTTCIPSIAGNDVVFRDSHGRTLTRGDIQHTSGTFKWEIQSARSVSTKALELHRLGQAAGRRGEYVQAFQHFSEASNVAPDWPQPVYDAAYTHLLQRQYDKALALYERVDQLAPRGFFTVKTAVHSLRLERAGKIPSGTYLRFLSLEWAQRSSEQEAIVRELTERSPSFAPGWKAKALLEENINKRLVYLERGLAANPDQETRGFLLLNKAAVLAEQGKKAEAVKLLGTLALDPASPLDIEALAKQSLATVIGR